MSFLFHYSHYGTIWPCFKFYVQSILDFGANITSPCKYTPSCSRMCGFFSTFPLLHHATFFHRVAFCAISCFNTTLHSFTAWLFQPFLVTIPPRRSWPRGFFNPISLLYPVTLSLGRGFFRLFPFLCPICIESAVYIWICSVITRRRTRLLGFASSTNSLPFHKHALPTVCNTRYLRVLFRH